MFNYFVCNLRPTTYKHSYFESFIGTLLYLLRVRTYKRLALAWFIGKIALFKNALAKNGLRL